jgi:phenylpyruvate tautomerase PptA (4-oxalocrotonate tautomerase family)
MPMIDVHVPEGLLPDGGERQLAEALTHALLRWEGAPLADPFLENTGAYVHVLPAAAVHTAGTDRARTVRIDVVTPPNALDREAQRGFVKEATDAVVAITGDTAQAGRTWVLLHEAAEGGWGVAGFALGAKEFAALRRS